MSSSAPSADGLPGEGQRAVFLSYASQDAGPARRICEALRAAGVEVWFDQSELRGGDAWDATIRRQIKSCALFVPVISANTRARAEGYFRLEWKLAVDRSHLMATEKTFIVPVVIDATSAADALVPERFNEVQWTRLPAGDTPENFVARIARLLAAGPASAGPAAVDAARGGTAAVTVNDPSTASAPVTAGAPVSSGRSGALLIVGAAAVLVAGYFVYAHLLASPRADATDAAAPTVSATAAAPAAAAVSRVPDKSIAVLPFLDMSEKKDQEYFSDGLSEDLIDLLSKIPDLRVPARTSSFYFKDQHATIAEIAKALGVAHVLEGSVRKAGHTIRVTVQLIRVDNGYHLWSETYDRDLKDVFKVQDEIARGVVDKLKLTLDTAVATNVDRPTNTEVHNLFLQGRYFEQDDSESGHKKAIDCFQRALAIDPGYASAWAELGYVYFRQVANGEIPVAAGLAQTSDAANKAIALDPGIADPYVVSAYVKMSGAHDWAGARADVDRALQLDPNNVRALFSDAHLTRIAGNSDAALAKFQALILRDPLNLLNRRYYARALYHTGRNADAEAAIREVLDMNPSFSAAHYELGRILLAQGKVAAAVTAFEAEPSPFWRDFGLPLGYHGAGRTADANAALAKLIQESDGAEYQVAEAQAYLGNTDEAFVWLNRAVDKDPGIQWLRGDPLFQSLTGDPRYADLLRRLKQSR